MDAPKCRLCDKRHYGLCSDAVVPPEPKERKPAKKLGRPKKLTTDGRSIVENPVPDWQRIEEVLARVGVLEGLVFELLEGRRRRSAYMVEYMRRYRVSKLPAG